MITLYPYDINEEWINVQDPSDSGDVYEYWNGEIEEQPYVKNNCDDHFGYCHNGQCNGSCFG